MTTSFSDEAQRDIRKIGVWTYEQWGDTQVDVYNAHLTALLLAIAKEPYAPASRIFGNATPSIRFRHIRSIFRRGRHFVYYRVTEDGVHILRVLHDKMLAGEHLKFDESELG